MAKNNTLNKAKDAKNDEFYTRIEDIEQELRHYKKHFEGKIVFCNCDDPDWSNFWRYFQLNFYQLGLKKLVSTHYEKGKKSYKLEICGNVESNGQLGIPDYIQTELEGDGDFRSEECIAILQEADIVVTNPPFSLFREYVAQLIEFDKKFLIIGNPNALHYKEIFPLVKENKVWVGYKSMSSDMLFNVTPEFAEWLVANKKKGSGYRIVNGEIKGRSQAIWFTNLDIEKRHEELILFKPYIPEEYPHYDNFDAIDVKKVCDIPMDYFGIMGVPDSFLDSYNPEQFEIIGLSQGKLYMSINGAKGISDKFREDYKNQGGKGSLGKNHPMLCYYDITGKAKVPFSRILIRRKK